MPAAMAARASLPLLFCITFGGLLTPATSLLSDFDITHGDITTGDISNDEAADWLLSRREFPEDFAWGSATSAYQVEGAVNEGGRGPSIWDEIVRMPGVIANGDNGDVAVDQYHRFHEDIDLMVDIGMDHYRFSISWPRIIPEGEGAINLEGIAYYNRLIDALLAKGVEPVVTLFHWDLPLNLHRKYGGWLNESLVPLFARYAETCFGAFGDRVKRWVTFNEPRIEYQREFLTACVPACQSSPDCSALPPGLPCSCEACQDWLGGLFRTVPYTTSHTILLSHAAAAKIYNSKFKPVQGGQLGITLDCEWAEPMTESPADVAAAQRYLLFNLGWFLFPLLKGDYPLIMRQLAGGRLPIFSEEQKKDFQGSLDFLGLNQYTARYAEDAPKVEEEISGYYDDICCRFTEIGTDGRLIGPKAGSDWLYVYPPGMKRLLLWIHAQFPDFPIYITENGYSDKEHVQEPESYFNDVRRVHYYSAYLREMAKAIKSGVNVKGYFAWSTVDNFEWKLGYTERFGVFYVDYANNLTRIPKKSAFWWKNFLKGDGFRASSEKGGALSQ